MLRNKLLMAKRTGMATMTIAIVAIAIVFFIPNTLRAQDTVRIVHVADGIDLPMVFVHGGTFIMGGSDNAGVKVTYEASRPQHEVSVDDYYICRYEVTQALWKAVMGENPSKFNHADSLPVEQVSWEEAQQFVTLLSQMTGLRFRLPTEAEWEYAARGGVRSTKKPYAGSDRGSFDRYGWYCANSDQYTHPVGRLRPNELGLYDMCGNVAEWCSDWMGEYSAARQSNPHGPHNGEARIMRGGHYNSISSACTVYDRGWYLPTGKFEYFGLRVAMDVPDEEE